MKFPYDLPWLPLSSGPKRWDVVVFRYPGRPEESYIKRLVGLSEDVVRIWHGDISIKPSGSKDFHQERRPLYHQQAMQMMVHDDSHRPIALADHPEWRRWAAKEGENWSEEKTAQGTYVSKPGPDSWSELRYSNLVPDPLQWASIKAKETPAKGPRPILITDFYSYNTNLSSRASDLTGSVDVVLSVYNPNRFKLDAAKLTYRVDIDSIQLGSGALDNQFVVQSGDSSLVHLPIRFSYVGLGLAGRSLITSGSINYRVRGDFTVGTPIGSFTRPYDRTGRYSSVAGIGR